MIAWGDINARARGLATHLLAPWDVARLAEAPDLSTLAGQLAAHGYRIPDAAGASPASLELAVRRRAAAALRVLGRWVGPRSDVLAVVFEDEDRRSLRAIVRGALQGVAAERRLAGLLPTPALPERALGALAALPSVREVADLLEVWNNPYGSALHDLARDREPDAFRLEVALNRAFAARARKNARRGGRELRAYVSLLIDIENAVAALLLADAPDIPPSSCFLEGGERVDEDLVAKGDRRRLVEAFADTGMDEVFTASALEPHGFERRLLAALIARARHRARVAPLGPAPLLSFTLRLRAEVIGLQRLIWGIAMGADAAHLTGAAAEGS